MVIISKILSFMIMGIIATVILTRLKTIINYLPRISFLIIYHNNYTIITNTDNKENGNYNDLNKKKHKIVEKVMLII